MRQALALDLRYALRLFARSPLFALTAVVSLAVGIGANAAVFGIVNAILKPRSGIVAPGELVDIGRSQDGSGFDNMSYPNYVDLRDRNTVLQGVAGYDLGPQPMSLTVPNTSEAERIFSGTVSSNYFDVLGVKTAAGRFFSPDEDRVAGQNRAVVLSDRFWARRFNRDPAIVSGSLVLNGQPYAVVGVASPEFRGTSIVAPDVWVTIHSTIAASTLESRPAVWMIAIGRLRPGVSPAAAQSALNALGSSLEQAYPQENRGKNFVVTRSRVLPGDLSVFLYAFLGLLSAIVGLILLIACVNLAGMLLAQATARRREIGVRLALGASRRRVIGQMLVETMTLFSAGSLLGLIAGRVFIGALMSALPQLPVSLGIDVSIDIRVIAATALLALVAGAASGLLPALQATRTDVLPALRDEPGTGGRMRRLRLRSTLVVAQVALSLILMVGAALFVRSLQRAASINPGFDPRNVEFAMLDLSLAGYRREPGLAFTRRLLESASTLPNIRSAALTLALPLSGGGFSLGGFRVPGVDLPAGQSAFDADWNIVSPAYFDTLRIPIVAGRAFDARDRQGAPSVAIVNETMARRFWPGVSAVGRRIVLTDDGNTQELEIVGVARNSKYRSLGDDPRLFIYVPLEQQYNPRITLLTRTDSTRSSLPAVREAIRSIDPNLPIVTSQTLEEFMSISLIPQRVLVSVAGSLGIVGLLLAALGVYGVTAYAVTRRTREIGIRMALGADRPSVLRLMMWQGMGLVVTGLAIGLVSALGVMRLVANLLYGITPADPIAYGVTLGLFTLVTVAASFLPARRAASIDPTLALRSE